MSTDIYPPSVMVAGAGFKHGFDIGYAVGVKCRILTNAQIEAWLRQEVGDLPASGEPRREAFIRIAALTGILDALESR